MPPKPHGQSSFRIQEQRSQSRGAGVEHRQEKRRFVLAIERLEAELTYQLAGSILRIDHTGVPPRLQHQGLANLLAEAALAYAQAQAQTQTQELRVDPQCRFMAVYIKRHPEHHGLLA